MHRCRRGQNFFLQYAEGIESRFDEFVRAESLDTGKPYIKLGPRHTRAISNLKFFATLIQTETLEALLPRQTMLEGTELHCKETTRGGWGDLPVELTPIVAHMENCSSAGHGNTVIIKPSEHTPTSATLLAKVVAEIDASAGIVNVLHGKGPMSVGEMIAAIQGSMLSRSLGPQRLVQK
ncbi:MAG: hypothetical protein CM15mP125_0470 [Gammaproteobacteria bacterium]|nr:MAG: hypothetical protein CM15mP125_0470 [Gammaproteobacteria bacterium]